MEEKRRKGERMKERERERERAEGEGEGESVCERGCGRKCLFRYLTFLELTLSALVHIKEQFAIYQIGIVPSRFYATLTQQPVVGFESLLVHTFLVIAFVVATKSTASFLSARLALESRLCLTRRLHTLYFHDFASFYVNSGVREHCIENP